MSSMRGSFVLPGTGDTLWSKMNVCDEFQCYSMNRREGKNAGFENDNTISQGAISRLYFFFGKSVIESH